MDSYRAPLSPARDINRGNPSKTEPAAPTIQADEILTVQEAADYLKVKKRAIYNLISEGKIKGKRINSWNWRILRSEIDRFMRRN
jgi:excisionase family DNA binding protein